jgi:hypothetical protein
MRPPGEDAWDQLDVPATVVCAICGDPSCASCALDPITQSGIVNVIPWERPGGTAAGRLWATARGTTTDVESFFGALPDGPVGPALSFALITEILAASAWAVLAGLAASAVFPAWAHEVVRDPRAVGTAARAVCGGVPALALLLVAGHVAHGVSLDRGARKTGARSARRRALRFGLYATGWDLVIGPLGALVLLLKEGPRAAMIVTKFGAGLPTRSAQAFLARVYGLDGARARVALRESYVAAAVATLVATLLIFAGVVVAVIALPSGLF